MGKSTPAAADLSEILARLERWLGKHRPEFLRALCPGASQTDLDDLASELGRPLPADLRTLLSWHNGQDPDAVGCLEQNWRLMSSSEIGKAEKELKAAAASGKSNDHWDAAWIPFLDDDAGNYVCLDTSRSGVPLREVILGRSNQQLLAASLTAWLEDFVNAVERGEYVEDPERGAFIRKSTS